MGRWVLSSAQFSALWTRTGQDRIPYPFAVSSSVTTLAEYSLQQNTIREAFEGPEHDHLAAALLLIAEPDIRIELAGFVGSAPLRIIGAMDGHHGIVALQRPGQAPGTGGDVVMLGCEPYDVARQVLAQIPNTDPGKYRGVQFRSADAASSGGVLRSPTAEHPLRPVADLLDRPSIGEGMVKVVSGPRHDSVTRGGTSWRDIDADGRYIVFGTDTVTVQPGTSWDLLDVLNRLTGTLPAGQAR
ncbi:MAG: ESX secretion-associated protein EspG [Rhodococcus sp.]|nr:ESX secretion-associated protein EspG [Rhodococcus sp. (in: high G+C Gram-positive bacteria)]